MKGLFLGLVISLALVSVAVRSVAAQSPQSQEPTRFSLRTFGPYNLNRLGYESLPVKVTGNGGGKLGPRERFRLHASMLKNDTAKKITAVKFSYFIFKFGEDELVETVAGPLVTVDLPPFTNQKVEIVVGYVDDIAALRYQPGKYFDLELAVTEAYFEDGSVWQATDLPQKLDPAKIH